MRKILGVLVAVLLLLVSAIVTAKPQTAITIIGPISACMTTSGSEIGVQVDGLATADKSDLIVTILAGEIIVIFNQHATFTGSSETIEVGCSNTALFMGSDIDVSTRNEGIFVSMPRVAETIDIFAVRQMFDSAISICFDQAKLAIFMENTEVEQLLKGPRTLAVIHRQHLQLCC